MEELKTKVTLASRVDPTIKEKILEAAEQEGYTPSAYIESILAASFLGAQDDIPETFQKDLVPAPVPLAVPKQNGHSSSTVESPISTESSIEMEDETDMVEDEMIPDPVIVENMIIDLPEDTPIEDEDMLELQSQIEDLVLERDTFAEKNEELLKSTLPISAEEQEEFNHYLENLRGHYPDEKDEDLILGALFAACCNETKWGQYIVKSFLSRSKEQRISTIPSKTKK